MSKVLRTVAVVAGAVALVATGVGAVAAAGSALAATAGSVATYASLAAGVASVGAQLTAPKPIARGSPAQLTIDIEPPRPYAVGQVMVGGVLRHDVAYGPTLKKVPNPYRWQVRVLSGVGPIQGVVGEYFDFQPIGSFYSGFLNTTQSLGQRPQPAALVPPLGAAPGWGSASRLSGCAHVGLNFKFDREGERYASGLPVYTALIDGEKVYDPRLDSTYPGGSGSCRAGVESTYVYSRNPACHALTYVLGRFQNGIRLFGLGQPVDTVDLAAIVDWANDCDANGWTVNMVLQEGGTGANLREQRVRNLDDLCAAGGGRWYQAGGLLSFDWHRPRISLATLTDDDILEAGGGTDAVPTVRERMNGVRPQYVSPAHNWQQITAKEIVGTTYRAEDGAPLTQVYPLNGVTNPEQAGELAAYAMADSRELGPMDVQAKVGWRFYRPGDTITVNSSLMAYSGQAVINQRSLNPQTLAVSLSLKSETPGKHDFALGKVADPPPSPVLAQTPEERDLLAAAAIAPRATDVGDLVAPANANRVPFSRIEGGRGWSSFLGSVASITPIFADEFQGRRYIVANATASAAGQIASIAGTTLFPVQPGERLSISLNLNVFEISGPPPAFWQVLIDYFLGDTYVPPAPVIFSEGGNIGNDALRQGFVTVPAGVSRARLVLLAQSGGAGTFQLNILNPMVTSAAPGQTVHPPFSPGPNASDGADPNNLITIVDGILSGIGTANITVDNARLPLGNANRVPFSRMEGNRGWGVTANPSGLSVSPLYGAFPAFPFFAAFVSATAAGQEVLIGQLPPGTPRFRVTPGERLSVQMRISANGPLAQWITTIAWVRSDGSITRETLLSGTAAVDTNEGFRQSFVTVPSDGSPVIGAFIDLYARSNGSGTLAMAIAEPMVTSAAPGQTVHPPFSPGPNASDGADPNNLITIDGAGIISGIGTANIFVDNRRTILSGLASARPASGAFIGQSYAATDTGEITQWDGFNWRSSADITFAISGPADLTLNYDSALNLTSPLPVTATYQLAAAGSGSLTSGVTWGVNVASGNFAGAAPSIVGTGAGQLRINSAMTSPTAELRITASFAGRSYPLFTVKISRNVAAPSNAGGGAAVSAPLTTISTSVFTRMHASDLTITLPAGVTSASLVASGSLAVDPTVPVGGSTVEGKWQRESSPGVWSDVGAVATSSPDAFVSDTGLVDAFGQPVYTADAGSISCNRTASGLAAGSTQKFRFVARVSSGSVRVVTGSGNVSATA